MAQAYRLGGTVAAFAVGGAIRVYRFVEISTTNNTITECDSEEVSMGVSLQAATASGDIIKIQKDGIAKVKVGSGGVTAGDFVNSDNDGQAVSESTTNKWASGKALRSADEGDIVEVDLDAAGYISSS